MAIAPEVIEQVRAHADIVDVVREYLPSLKKSGRNWKANCPFHNEKTPSFMVNAEKSIFHCFGCSAGGDVFKFVMLIDNLTWPEAVRKLAARAGITVRETREESVQRSEKQKIYNLLEQVAAYYHRCFLESPDAAAARAYWQQRGGTAATAEKFLLGYAPRKALLAAAQKKGFTAEQMIAAGAVTRTDRGTLFEYMSERLVFPIFDTQGRVVAFGGRTLKNDTPKYLNTPETAVYSKSQHLFGLFQALPAVRRLREVLVLEGYMDVVITQQEGVETTVATLGTALTPQHANLLNRYAEKAVLLFDADAAGVAAAKRAVDTLIETELTLGVASLPDGVDPDEYIIAHGREQFAALLAAETQPAVAFLTAQATSEFKADTPEHKAHAAAAVLPVIAKIKNAVVRREWTRYVAEHMDTTEDALRSELQRQRRPDTSRAARTAVEPSAVRDGTVVRTADEEILQVVLAFPEYRGQVPAETFSDVRCRRIFDLLLKNTGIPDIAAGLEAAESAWFTELALEAKEYTAPGQTLNNLLRDVQQQGMEERRRRLQQEIILMTSGKTPRDEDKIRLYQELTKQLKGSVKS